MLEHKKHFDLSDYPDTHHIFAGKTESKIAAIKAENKKIVGKFKDELNGLPLIQFVANKPKSYTYAALGKDCVTKEKGKPKCIRQTETVADKLEAITGQNDKYTRYRMGSMNHTNQLKLEVRAGSHGYDAKR